MVTNKIIAPNINWIIQGGKPALKGKEYVIGRYQALRCGKRKNALVEYIIENYNNYIHTNIKHKDKTVGMKLIVKTLPPMQHSQDNNTKTIIDKDGAKIVKYQIELKKYTKRKSKRDDNIQHIFIITEKLAKG